MCSRPDSPRQSLRCCPSACSREKPAYPTLVGLSPAQPAKKSQRQQDKEKQNHNPEKQRGSYKIFCGVFRFRFLLGSRQQLSLPQKYCGDQYLALAFLFMTKFLLKCIFEKICLFSFLLFIPNSDNLTNDNQNRYSEHADLENLSNAGMPNPTTATARNSLSGVANRVCSRIRRLNRLEAAEFCATQLK